MHEPARLHGGERRRAGRVRGQRRAAAPAGARQPERRGRASPRRGAAWPRGRAGSSCTRARTPSRCPTRRSRRSSRSPTRRARRSSSTRAGASRTSARPSSTSRGATRGRGSSSPTRASATWPGSRRTPSRCRTSSSTRRGGPIADQLQLYAHVPPGRILYASDMPYGAGALAAFIFRRCAAAVGLGDDAVRAIAGGQVERVVAGEEPLDVGPAPGPGALGPREVDAERVVTYASVATQVAFRGADPTEPLQLARLACRTWRTDALADLLAVCDEVLRARARGPRGAAGGPARDRARRPRGDGAGGHADGRRAASGRVSPVTEALRGAGYGANVSSTAESPASSARASGGPMAGERRTQVRRAGGGESASAEAVADGRRCARCAPRSFASPSANPVGARPHKEGPVHATPVPARPRHGCGARRPVRHHAPSPRRPPRRPPLPPARVSA